VSMPRKLIHIIRHAKQKNVVTIILGVIIAIEMPVRRVPPGSMIHGVRMTTLDQHKVAKQVVLGTF
jgi:hypothetical protein